MKKLLVIALVAMTGVAAFAETVCVVGAHPDDLVGSAGLCCLLDDAGFKIHVIDFTRGELGLGMAGLKDGSTGRRRVEEEKAACKIIHAEPHFIDEVDGFAYASSNAVAQLSALFRTIQPRAVIMHWPVDVHMDHAMSTAAALKALQLEKLDPEIYFFEETEQSMGFNPDVYVDITSVIDRRAAVVRAYACQNNPPWESEPDWILKRKQADAKFRGSRMSPPVAYAEAYATYGGRAPRARTIFTDLASRNRKASQHAQPDIFRKGEKILFIGDSITHGGRMNDMNHYLGHGFAAEIAMRYLADRPDLDLQFANRGVSGDSSSNLVARWSTDAVPFTPNETGYDGPFPGSKGKAVVPDWINILVGCNDDWSMKGAPPDAHEKNLRFMIESARKANPKVKIVICEEFHPLTADGKDGSAPAAIRRREVQRRLAKEYGLVFVPFHDFFQKTLMAEKPQMKWWMWDAVHPTYAAHKRMADFWIETVSKALSK